MTTRRPPVAGVSGYRVGAIGAGHDDIRPAVGQARPLTDGDELMARSTT
jgi:hypothetical protein